jgi:hypothetical protein
MASLFSEEPGFVVELRGGTEDFLAAARALGARAEVLGGTELGDEAIVRAPDGDARLVLDDTLRTMWQRRLQDAFDVGEEPLA